MRECDLCHEPITGDYYEMPDGLTVCPELLGFPVICAGRRVKIPKAAFVRFMKGETS